MGKNGCAVYNCETSKSAGRYRFPNPEKFPQLFFLWLQLIGNICLQNVDKKVIYETRRVCGKHFRSSDFTCSNRLKKDAYPQLFLPETVLTSPTSIAALIDHDYCKGPKLEDSSCSSVDFECERTPSPATPQREQNDTPPNLLPSTMSNGLLRNICVRTIAELTPKAKSLYKQAYHYKRMANRVIKQKFVLKERLKAAEKLSKERSFVNLASNLTSVTYNFLKRQIECAGRKGKGRRFSTEDKILALALYKQSPSAYKLLSAMFALPSRVTLQKLLSRIPITAGINDSVFSGLKGIAKQMSEKNKTCILMFDEMALSPNLQYNQHLDEVKGFEDFGFHKTNKIANHVQVYMLRGIASNWKQPLAYTFVNGGMKAPQIKGMIKKLIKLTKEAGFNIIATVCDQGSNNVSAVNELVKDTQRRLCTNDYIFNVDGENIIPIFDGPHLLKSVRNNLLTKNIYFEKDSVKRIARWKDIYTAYQMDAFSGHLRAMPKLTERHVNPEKINKMKVSTCAQVFSHTVAATMNLLIGKATNQPDDNETLRLDENARGTVEFVKFFDDLFDSINGSAKIDKCGKPLRTEVPTAYNSVHVAHWKAALPVLASMYVIKDGKKVVLPCFKNWQITLKNIVLLRKRLKDMGIYSFKPRHVNQDPLENFFGKIRQRGQRFTNPTSAAFEQFYKSLLVNNFVSKHSIGSNCEADDGNLLLTLQQFVTQGLPEEVDNTEENSYLVLPDSFNALKPLESAALGYVAGYIIKVRGLVKTCVACRYNVLKRNNVVEDFNCLIRAKEYGGNKMERLKYCNRDFVEHLIETYNIIILLVTF